MKFLWNIVSFLAVVHLLAIVGFVGWLWQSGRLDMERVMSVRDTFSQTLAEVEAEAKNKEEQDKLAAADSLAEQRLNSAPVTSGHQISMMSAVREFSMQSSQQLEQERSIFAKQLEESAAKLDEREAAFEARKQQWEAGIEAERKRRADDQFAKAVALLELMRPTQAKDTIVRLIREGNTDQAVAYLDAMSERLAVRVLQEMKDPVEAPMATDLLERIRRFGLEGEPNEVLSNADSVASAP